MLLRLFLLVPFVLISACGSEPAPKPLPVKREPQARPPEWRPVNGLLLRYDANKDGSLSRVEMEAGLKADFAVDDSNKDGALDASEVAAINRTRWDSDASAASPLIDWNNDAVVSFREYSATVHSLFDDFDKDGDGIVTAEELKPGGAGPKPGERPRMKRRN